MPLLPSLIAAFAQPVVRSPTPTLRFAERALTPDRYFDKKGIPDFDIQSYFSDDDNAFLRQACDWSLAAGFGLSLPRGVRSLLRGCNVQVFVRVGRWPLAVGRWPMHPTVGHWPMRRCAVAPMRLVALVRLVAPMHARQSNLHGNLLRKKVCV